MKNTMAASNKLAPQYIKIVNSKTLDDMETLEGQAIAAIAAYMGNTRLIDNMIISPS